MSVDPLYREFRDLKRNRELSEDQRYVDLCVEWHLPDGSVLLQGGGQWDRTAKRYTGERPRKGKIVRLQESQVESAKWAAWWLQERLEGRKQDFMSLFVYGDRGGGKTTFGVIFMITALIMFPDFGGGTTIGWQVSKSHAERDELDREIAALFPFAGTWYRYKEFPKHVYQFINGATLTNVSADDPDTLKRGRVDFLFVNEAAKMSKRVPVNGLARLKDKGGFGLFTSNPPDDQRGRWVFDWWEKEREARDAGKPYPVRYLRLLSSGNATKDDHTADLVAQAIRDIDPIKAELDLGGMMLRPGQPAYWEWSKSRARAVPDVGDATAQVLHERAYRRYEFLAGADFQGTPHQVAVFYKIFRDDAGLVLWAVDEIMVDQATEDELLDAVVEAGYQPETVLFIGDASGQWQDGKHNKNARDSFRVFKDRRFHIQPPIKPKDSTSRSKNPPVEQRVKLVNKCLREMRLIIDPERCPKLMEAFKECELKMGRYGRVIPQGLYAHITDAAGYPVWWLMNKPRLVTSGPTSKSIEIERKKVW